MELYTQGKKVGTLNSWDELRLGANHPYFIWQGDTLVYPNPVKDGLVLWYDFSGMTNTDHSRGTAYDLSRNGNHGTLQNFNYTAESGYGNNSLTFDGVDDSVSIPLGESSQSFSFLINLSILNRVITRLVSFSSIHFYLRIEVDGSIRLNTESYDGEKNSYQSVDSDEAIFQTLKENKHLGVVLDKDLIILYAEGIEVGRSKLKADIVPVAIDGLGYWRRTYGNANIHSFHVYNRALTPEEIAHNYAIEKERFSIEGEM